MAPSKVRGTFTGAQMNDTTILTRQLADEAQKPALVTRGLLWATGHLNDDGTPAKGYGPK